MSTNHAPTDTSDDAGSRPTSLELQRLLKRRQTLATAAGEHTAHDLPGVELLWQAVHATEERIRERFPDTWSEQYPGWIRGQNRLPGLAIASIIAALKVSVYNQEQLRAWHDRTGKGPADHPLLQPDPPYWGYRDLTKDEGKAIDAERLRRLQADSRPLKLVA